jgi:predicted nucleic acid-binding protein
LGELSHPKSNNGFESADPRSLFASVVTWGELRKGIESKPPAQRRPGLEQWLERDLRDWFQSRLLPVTKTIADRWGVLAGQSKLRGKTLTMADGIILATALEHDLIVVTRNVKDFLRPWSVDFQSLGSVPCILCLEFDSALLEHTISHYTIQEKLVGAERQSALLRIGPGRLPLYSGRNGWIPRRRARWVP